MLIEFCIDTWISPKSGRVSRYPWDRLNVGDVIVVYGQHLQPLDARNSAYRFAKTRGWKIKTNLIYTPLPRRIQVTRVL